MRGLLLALLLAGCAGPQGSPVERACQSQANDDPAVASLIMRGAGSESFHKDHIYDLRDAKREATLRCLRARGLAPQGGVAAPVHEPNLFNGLF